MIMREHSLMRRTLSYAAHACSQYHAQSHIPHMRERSLMSRPSSGSTHALAYAYNREALTRVCYCLGCILYDLSK